MELNDGRKKILYWYLKEGDFIDATIKIMKKLHSCRKQNDDIFLSIKFFNEILYVST